MTTTVPAVGGRARQAGSTAHILLYSDNAIVRNDVRSTVGDQIGADSLPLQWTEISTHPLAIVECERQRFDLIIMDNETSKLGGVGLIRQMRDELNWQPTVLLLLARPQDAWLAAWAGADAALLQPFDPFELVSVVAKLLGAAQE